jgi:hypothetical protein
MRAADFNDAELVAEGEGFLLRFIGSIQKRFVFVV